MTFVDSFAETYGDTYGVAQGAGTTTPPPPVEVVEPTLPPSPVSSQYRLIVTPTLSGASVLGTVTDFTEASVRHILNAPGSFSVTLPVEVYDPDLWVRAARSVFLERNGLIVGGGVLLTRESDGDFVRLAGEGLWTHFRRIHLDEAGQSSRRVGTGFTWTGVDQLTIARDLMAYAQSKADCNVGLLVGDEASGVMRTRLAQTFDLVNVGQMVEDMAKEEDGFDFRVDVAWDPGATAPVRRLLLGFPATGRRAGDHVIFHDGNLVARTADDATELTRRALVVGGGEGPARLRATSTDHTLAGQFPAWERVESSTITTKDFGSGAQGAINGKAKRLLRENKAPSQSLTGMADLRSPDIAFGGWAVGDEARVRLSHYGIDEYWRIVEWGLTVKGGTEEVPVSFAPEPVLSAA